ncbi:hypothetical protein BASA60_002356 [Batrachochytrium salamandrivorans]|nr:hypothetical protein BASA60_002356 [Batrachochytrium salamandrivorans]
MSRVQNVAVNPKESQSEHFVACTELPSFRKENQIAMTLTDFHSSHDRTRSDNFMDEDLVDPLTTEQGRRALERLDALLCFDLEDSQPSQTTIGSSADVAGGATAASSFSSAIVPITDNTLSNTDMSMDATDTSMFRLFASRPLVKVQIHTTEQEFVVANPRVLEVTDEQEASLRLAFQSVIISAADVIKEAQIPAPCAKGLIVVNKAGHIVDPAIVARGGTEYFSSSRRNMSSRRRRVEREIQSGKMKRRAAAPYSSAYPQPFHWLKPQLVVTGANRGVSRGRGTRGLGRGLGRGRGVSRGHSHATSRSQTPPCHNIKPIIFSKGKSLYFISN